MQDDQPTAAVVGLGLIGGSIGLALRARGWRVTGADRSDATVAEAVQRGVIDGPVGGPVDLTFVATPVLAVEAAVREALARGSGIVTDVGSVKAPIVDALADEPVRFLGGHPMAGSELRGLDGADASLFEGAVWVLTPTAQTPDRTFATVAQAVGAMGAEVVALAPDHHDALVAVVSHVPHLTAATLMALASDRAEEHAALLRLAAGGFRDMTRIAAGHPDIWLDICEQNRKAIVDTLDALIGGLTDMRSIVAAHDRDGLRDALERARTARVNLPVRGARPAGLVEVRTTIPDRPGAASEVFTLAAELGVNVYDFEVAHSAEGERGVLIVVIDAAAKDVFRGGLIARGFRPSMRPLE